MQSNNFKMKRQMRMWQGARGKFDFGGTGKGIDGDYVGPEPANTSQEYYRTK